MQIMGLEGDGFVKESNSNNNHSMKNNYEGNNVDDLYDKGFLNEYNKDFEVERNNKNESLN